MSTHVHRPRLTIRGSDVAALWLQVARVRENEGDRAGATQARRQARIYRGRHV